jgi:N-methylhydantoinase B
MPAESRTLDDEGVVIAPKRVGEHDLERLAEQMREPGQRLADLRAQRAANLVGERRLLALAERHGLDVLRAGMTEILDYAERRTRAALSELPDGTYEASDVLEDDARGRDVTLRLTARIDGDRLLLDFSGTEPQVEGNLNCPLSVTKSACFFAVRVLTDPDAPPSAGAHRPVEVGAPAGSLLHARYPAAVAAGNVETSSRVADLVIEALAPATPVPAQGQGTMNNVTLSNDRFTYYETIGGGQGACPGANGPSAIHVAMSNTLNTPVEALESELPIRIRELSVRRESGGAGERHGGDGMVREIEALVPMAYALITERRRHAPRGREGGADGAPGRNLLNGEPLPSKASGDLRPGDRLRIETPGGGGHGKP